MDTKELINQYLAGQRTFRGVVIRYADLAGIRLIGADLSKSDLREANLQKANLSGANLQGAILEDADLRQANLEGTNLGGAALSGASFRDANLKDCQFQGANLVQTDLSFADLRGANLQDANLTNALLEGAKLEGTILSASPSETREVELPSPREEDIVLDLEPSSSSPEEKPKTEQIKQKSTSEVSTKTEINTETDKAENQIPKSISRNLETNSLSTSETEILSPSESVKEKVILEQVPEETSSKSNSEPVEEVSTSKAVKLKSQNRPPQKPEAKHRESTLAQEQTETETDSQDSKHSKRSLLNWLNKPNSSVTETEAE